MVGFLLYKLISSEEKLPPFVPLLVWFIVRDVCVSFVRGDFEVDLKGSSGPQMFIGSCKMWTDIFERELHIVGQIDRYVYGAALAATEDMFFVAVPRSTSSSPSRHQKFRYFNDDFRCIFIYICSNRYCTPAAKPADRTASPHPTCAPHSFI